ncbi:MAG: diguanylate cyclase [Anaerolineaceae bacterium]|nr:diguanylate cyclase [Anaerolineaceae bacterium]
MKKPRIGWSLITKLTLAYSISILLVSGVMAFRLSWQVRTAQSQALQDRLFDIVRFAAPQVDGDFHSLIRSPEDENSSFYRVVYATLETIQDTSNIIDRIYTLRQKEDDGLIFVVDIDPVEHKKIGQDYLRTSPALEKKLAGITGPVIENELYTDTTGIHLSGYAPIYDQFGEVDGVLGIDINAAIILENEAKARRTALATFLATVPLSLLLGWWLTRYLTAPINDLVSGAKRVAQGQLDQAVPVRSQDEIGVLANTFNQMTTQLSQTLDGLEKEIAEHKQSEKVQDCIYRISQAVNTTNTIEEFYASIHSILGELIPVENFYIALLDPVSNLISFPYSVDQYDEKPLIMEPARGLTGYVMRTGLPLLATPEVFARLIQEKKIELVGTKPVDWLGTPLKVEKRTIGVVVVQSYSEEIRFNQENLNLMRFVSSQVALAIDHKRAAEMLQQSNERYRNLFEDSPISLWEEDFSAVKHLLDSLRADGVTDFESYLASHPEFVAECVARIQVLDVNKATLALFGAKNKEEILKNISTIFSEESYELFQKELVYIAEGQTQFNWNGVNQTLDGRLINVGINWYVMPGFESNFSKVIVSLLDITERKKAETKLKQMSTHDGLTGLYNRAFFDEEMARLEDNRQSPVSIVMTDLDDLKKINDCFGHAVGDKMLQQTAKVLKDAFRTEDIIARIGGDEFAVLLPNITADAAENMVQRIKDNLKIQNTDSSQPALYLSLGVSTAEINTSLIDALKQADTHMYLDKQTKGSDKLI